MAHDIIASCCAGLVSRMICHPVDTLKARLQARQTITGLTTGMYRGLAAALVGGVPATCIYLTSYEASKRHLSSAPWVGESPFLVYFCSGIVAEGMSCSVFVPTDVVKERLQVGLYKSSADALKQILTQEGFRGLYKGYGASMLSFGPFSALYFAFYEGLKQHAFKAGQFSDNLYSSALAGAAASYLTNPLDLAKLRLQILRSSRDAAESVPATTASMLGHVFRAEGLPGLFRGALARVLFHTPNTCITMVAFEETKKLLRAGQ